jgi:hypothetical protein
LFRSAFLRDQISVAKGRVSGEKSSVSGENSGSYFPAGAALIGAMDIGFNGMISGSCPGL